MATIVIGAGAAGMIAAWRAASLGAEVILLEKNSKLGIKILISGGGKCNITHGGNVETLRQQFQINEARFLKYAFHTFTNTDLLQQLKEYGVETYERDNGKVFPMSHKAGDVVHALRRMMEKAGVDIRLNSSVTEILKDESGIYGVKVNQEILETKSVIVAVGGTSFQKTGTTGDGYSWAMQLGHALVPIRPALAPIFLLPKPPAEWQGTPIRDCLLMAKSNTTTISQWGGDILFTHVGISGPATLEVSRKAYVEFEKGNLITMCVDFFPELTIEEIDQKILTETMKSGAKQTVTLIEQFVPQKLGPHILQQAKVNEIKKLHQLGKQERRSLSETLKNCSIGTVKEIPLDGGEVTAGGIDLREVKPATMESKLVKGLFFCGEILDVAGPVGGYNLQAAFSTGFVAGESASKI
ncbi:MAG: NAD(P)/FAD-dependent oxidoreductase [Bacteroidota bacterium]|nr:NAD(P)/FAD-dependent oxidoreductase [Bacteroidota bacterium]